MNNENNLKSYIFYSNWKKNKTIFRKIKIKLIVLFYRIKRNFFNKLIKTT